MVKLAALAVKACHLVLQPSDLENQKALLWQKYLRMNKGISTTEINATLGISALKISR